MSQRDAKIESLVAAYLDDTLSAEETAELDLLLGAESQAADALTEAAEIDELLERFYADNRETTGAAELLAKLELEHQTPDPPEPITQSPPAVTHSCATRFARQIDWQRHPAYFLLAVAAIWFGAWVFFGSVVLPWHTDTHVADASDDTLTLGPVVARLTHSVGAVWTVESDVKFDVGHIRPGQRLDLADGLAEITFVSGAKVNLRGPARFVVEPSGEPAPSDAGYLEHGRLVATVPNPAKGFTISTSTTTIVDLGTEFGVKANASNEVSVAVYDGEVELATGPAGALGQRVNRVRLNAGKAVRIDSAGRIAHPVVAPERFVSRMPQKQNAIENGGFAETTRHWIITGNSNEIAFEKNFDRCTDGDGHYLKMLRTNEVKNPGAAILQVAEVVPGMRYDLRLDAKKNGSHKAALQIDVFDGDATGDPALHGGTALRGDLFSQRAELNSTYAKIGREGLVPASDRVTIRMSDVAQTSSGLDIWIDNVVMRPRITSREPLRDEAKERQDEQRNR